MSLKIQAAFVKSDSHPFRLMWNDKGSGARYDVQTWRPQPPEGWSRIGDIAESSFDHRNYGKQPRGTVLVVKDASDGGDRAIRHPQRYERIWKDSGSDAALDGSFWRPVPHDDYVALGHMAMIEHDDKPDISDYVCVHKVIVSRGDVGMLIWADRGSGATVDVSLWQYSVNPTLPDGVVAGSFISVASHDAPFNQNIFILKPESVKLATL